MSSGSKKQTIGYRYSLGEHLALVHGPVDKCTRLRWDERVAWEGSSTGGRIDVDAGDLFGGDKREGGVSGAIDFETGAPAQGRNSYLQARLGTEIPAFRGVASLVFRQLYLGNNPYLKPMDVRLQRIHVRQDGVEQWYDATAQIGGDVDAYAEWRDYDGWLTTFTGWAQQYQGEGATVCSLIGELSPQVVIMGSGRFYTAYPENFDALNVVGGGFTGSNADFDGALSFICSYGPLLPNWMLIPRAGGFSSFDCPEGSTCIAVLTPEGEYEPRCVTNPEVLGDDPPVWPLPDPVPGPCPSMNPAHIIRECLTDPDWGMGYPEEAIDDASFTAAADQLFSEQMGISILWDRESTIQDFVDLIVQHIDAALYVSRTTGKFILKLIRSDYNVATILELGEGEIERVDNYSRPAFGELINEITVNYWDCKMSKTATVTAHNDALIQLQGGVIGTTINYPGFTNAAIAGRVALRDLNALSRQLVSCTIYANREAAQLEIGDVFKLVWPDTHDGYIVMRVTGMALGDGRTNKIRIECVEDVFALPGASLTVEPETEWVNPSAPPLPADTRLVIEAPYYEVVRELGEVDAAAQLSALPEAGWLTATAARPDGALNATLTVDSGAGYEDQAIVDFCPMAVLADSEGVGPTDTVWEISNPVALDELRIGSWAQIDDEIVRIDAASDTSITVGRGCLDTVPTAHDPDTPIFFAQDFLGAGETTFVDSDVLNAKLLPASGAGVVSISQAATDVVTIDQRANRPYAPGNFQIDGAAYPAEFTRTATTTVTWAHRDRLQQTGGVLEDTTEGNIGPESGTTYTAQLLDPNNADALIAELTGISGTSAVFDTSAYAQTAVKFVLWSVRGGVASWQRHEWTADVESAFAEVAPVTLTAPSATASTA